MKKWLRNRKAVSPVIAALLLIAISVAAAVITYSWVMTMIEGQGSQAQTTIRFEEVQFDYVNVTVGGPLIHYQVKIGIRNSGGVTAEISTIYIYDGTTRLVKNDSVAYAIPAGDTKEVGFSTQPGDLWTDEGLSTPNKIATIDVTLVLSKAYMIRIVTDNGFTIEGTFYTPAAW